MPIAYLPPKTIIDAAVANGFCVLKMDFVDDAGSLHRDLELQNSLELSRAADADYGCGIFQLRKIGEPAG
jgi:hypothetical protein